MPFENKVFACDVLSTISEAHSFLIWCEKFPAPDNLEDAWAIGDEHEHISNAILMYSFLALRRLDEFLKSDAGRTDDLRCSDIGLNRATIMGGEESLLLAGEKTMINKMIAHHTKFGLADGEVETDYKTIMNRVGPLLILLEQEINLLQLESQIVC